MQRIAIASILSIMFAAPSLAAGEIVITQVKALAGNVTPGDTPGFPVTLSLPGAYVLESNLTVTAGTYGLFVTASNVDLDMNGFALSGNEGSGTYGLISGYGESRIHGGVITRFRYSGIYLRGNMWTIEDMKIIRNGSLGIDAKDARFTTLNESLVASNGDVGVLSGDNGLLRGNDISKNGNTGIVCLESCHIEGNLLDSNYVGVVITNGMAIGNTISRSKDIGLYDVGSVDAGLASNFLLNNNAVVGGSQIIGGKDVHPNTCVGNPC